MIACHEFSICSSEFILQIGESAGAECKAALQEVTKLVEEKLVSDGKTVKTLFGASEVQFSL